MIISRGGRTVLRQPRPTVKADDARKLGGGDDGAQRRAAGHAELERQAARAVQAAHRVLQRWLHQVARLQNGLERLGELGQRSGGEQWVRVGERRGHAAERGRGEERPSLGVQEIFQGNGITRASNTTTTKQAQLCTH